MAHWLVVAVAVADLAWVGPKLAADVTEAITPLSHLSSVRIADALLPRP